MCVACGGTSIGHKGMLVATKTLAQVAATIYLDPSIAERAHDEWAQRRGDDFVYTPLLGQRQPPLDYRD